MAAWDSDQRAKRQIRGWTQDPPPRLLLELGALTPYSWPSIRWGIQASSCVGPGKSNLPLELRERARDCSRVTSGQKRPHLSLCISTRQQCLSTEPGTVCEGHQSCDSHPVPLAKAKSSIHMFNTYSQCLALGKILLRPSIGQPQPEARGQGNFTEKATEVNFRGHRSVQRRTKSRSGGANGKSQHNQAMFHWALYGCAQSLSHVQLSVTPMDCNPPGSSVHGDSPGKNTGPSLR